MEIAIISGKGGTGKSSISAAFATLNGEVVLADCDVDAANLFYSLTRHMKKKLFISQAIKLLSTIPFVTTAGVALTFAVLMPYL